MTNKELMEKIVSYAKEKLTDFEYTYREGNKLIVTYEGLESSYSIEYYKSTFNLLLKYRIDGSEEEALKELGILLANSILKQKENQQYNVEPTRD